MPCLCIDWQSKSSSRNTLSFLPTAVHVYFRTRMKNCKYQIQYFRANTYRRASSKSKKKKKKKTFYSSSSEIFATSKTDPSRLARTSGSQRFIASELDLISIFTFSLASSSASLVARTTCDQNPIDCFFTLPVENSRSSLHATSSWHGEYVQLAAEKKTNSFQGKHNTNCAHGTDVSLTAIMFHDLFNSVGAEPAISREIRQVHTSIKYDAK